MTTHRPPTLSTAPLEHLALDFAALRRLAIRELERLAGGQWTDFNAHDPGITILEQLCYALTDLAYRATHELPDLLSEPGPEAYPRLFKPAQILPSEPVTLLDLRKLIVDVPGVKNAWIEPIASSQPELYYHEGRRELGLVAADDTAERVDLKGLYRVEIETSELSSHGGAAVERLVTRTLHAHRNLCEDFAEVVVLDPLPVRVHARVEIGPVADAEALLASLYARLADAISPAVRFHTLRERLAAGGRLDELLSGPLLTHGFVDDEALQALQRPRALHTSDLIQAMMATPGVRAVRDIAVSAEGGPREPWTLPLPADRAPRLALREPGPGGRPALTITLVREQIAVAVDEDEVVRRYKTWLLGQAKRPPLARDALDLGPPRGEDRQVARYRSVQHELPATYGVGHVGLPDSAPPERKAEAQQLRAYLTFFDQILAACFAQLAHAGRLLGCDPAPARAYFAAEPTDPALMQPDLWQGGQPPTLAELQALVDAAAPASADQRRGRFLDHLLARFGEELTDYSLILFGALRSAESSTRAAEVRERIARDKEALLRHVPAISGRRGRALDLLAPPGPDNTAGLAERLGRKLGLVAADGERFHLIEHILLRPVREDRNQLEGGAFERVPLLAAARSRDPYSLQLSLVFPDWPPRLRHPAFRRLVEQTVREETPAHLTVYVHWVGADAWDALGATYQRWLDLRREDAGA